MGAKEEEVEGEEERETCLAHVQTNRAHTSAHSASVCAICLYTCLLVFDRKHHHNLWPLHRCPLSRLPSSLPLRHTKLRHNTHTHTHTCSQNPHSYARFFRVCVCARSQRKHACYAASVCYSTTTTTTMFLVYTTSLHIARSRQPQQRDTHTCES